MQKLILLLGIIPLGLVVGQILKAVVDKKGEEKSSLIEKYVKNTQKLALLGMNPLIVVGAFWILKIENMKLMIIPVLGLLALVLGGVLGYFAGKIMKLEKKQRGSLLISASFTNMGTFGGLICYILYGEISYAFVSMYRLFEELFYYTIGYPVAKAHGNSDNRKTNILNLIRDPYILVSFSSIVIGITLNVTGIVRPNMYSLFSAMLIPVSSFLLVTSVGFKMRVSTTGKYLRESLVVSVIKFIVVPVIITSTAYALGIGELSDGLALKVILILSAMPPAFNSLIPPQIYELDGDLSNSSWLINTGALAIVVPVLYMIQSRF